VSTASGVTMHLGRPKLGRAVLIIIGVVYVAVLLVAPLIGIVVNTFDGGFGVVTETLSAPDVRHAYWLTLVIAVGTVIVTGILGITTAWVLARHRFPGRSILDALVDLPMAVSPVIVGLMAVLLFGRGGWFEPFFAARGIEIVFALPSMILVTTFICIPFVIREVVPILREIGVDEEEAAKTLGASPLQTFFRVTLPNVKRGFLYGIALTTARAIGEIGAVLIVSGSLQGQTETAPLYIFRALEERQDEAGFVVALTLGAASILLLIAIESLKRKRDKELER
jgi:sulfate/thiosulfate transport system permease protein